MLNGREYKKGEDAVIIRTAATTSVYAPVKRVHTLYAVPEITTYQNLTCPNPRKQRQSKIKAGLLACSAGKHLPIPDGTVVYRLPVAAYMPHRTYSCGTACDLHTVPF